MSDWPVVLRRAIMALGASLVVAIFLRTIEATLGVSETWSLVLNQIPISLTWGRVWRWSATPAPSEPSR